MLSLRELQRHFAEAVLDGSAAVEAFAADQSAQAPERFGVYRRTVFANYRNALAATYPIVHRLVGDARFKSAVYAYVHAHPSTCGDLNVYGDRVPRTPNLSSLAARGTAFTEAFATV